MESNDDIEKDGGSSSSESFIEINDEHFSILNINNEDNLILDTQNGGNSRHSSDTTLEYDTQAQDTFNVDSRLYNKYTRCDSPITISNHGSLSGSCNSSDIDEMSSNVDSSNNLVAMYSNKQTLSLHDIANMTQQNLSNVVKHSKHRYSHYKQIDVHEAEQKFENYYSTHAPDNNYTNEIDILTTFMKGQKNLYIQSRNVTQWKYYCLMLPTLIISCFITVTTPFIKCENRQTGIVSGLNAIIALLISLINFLKLESTTQSFFLLANQFDKLETMLELTNGKLIILENEEEKKKLVLKRINEIEQKIFELKDTNEFLIPEEIKVLFPVICHINIFSFIKKMQSYRNDMIKQLQNVKNEINYILHKWKKQSRTSRDNSKNDFFSMNYEKERKRLDYLHDLKDRIKNDISEYRNVYSHMDEIFTREIKLAEHKTNSCGVWYICFWNYMKINDPTYSTNKNLPQDSQNKTGKCGNMFIDNYFHNDVDY